MRRRASAHVLPRSRVSLYGGTRRWSHVHGSRCHPRDRASGLSCASRVGLWGGLWAVGAFAGVPSFFCAQSRESTVLYFFISSMYLYRYTVYALRLQSYKRRPRASCRECRASVRAAVCVRPAPQSLLRGTIRDSVVARARIPYSFHVKRIRDPRTAARGAGHAPGAPRAGSRKRLGRDWFSGRIKLYTSYIPRECGFEGGIAAELAPARTTHAGRPMAKRHEACVPSPQAGPNCAFGPRVECRLRTTQGNTTAVGLTRLT